VESDIYNFYSTQLSYEQIEQVLSQQNKWEWLGYVLLPIIYLIKIGLITLCVYTGFFLALPQKVKFREIMPAVVKVDMLFLIPAFIKVTWFTFNVDYTLQDLQYFMPGSLLNFFDPSLVESWLLYPLQAFNIYEVAFWFILAYQLKEFFEEDFRASFKTVALSYGSSFVVWVVFVMFLSINLS
jgi:hypothetical protein